MGVRVLWVLVECPRGGIRGILGMGVVERVASGIVPVSGRRVNGTGGHQRWR